MHIEREKKQKRTFNYRIIDVRLKFDRLKQQYNIYLTHALWCAIRICKEQQTMKNIPDRSILWNSFFFFFAWCNSHQHIILVVVAGNSAVMWAALIICGCCIVHKQKKEQTLKSITASL